MLSLHDKLDYFGSAAVTNRVVLQDKGRAEGAGQFHFVRVDGVITSIDAKEFGLRDIVTQVSHINGGAPCTREGEFTFKVTASESLAVSADGQSVRPCEDYVDVYVR